MWEIQNQIRLLLDRTLMANTEVVQEMNVLGMQVHPSELTRAIKAERPTPKQQETLLAWHRILTDRMEQLNEEKASAIRRAEIALAKAESLDSIDR